MLEAAVTDAVGDDWQHRIGVGWFLALPLVLAAPVWLSFESILAVPLGAAGGIALVGYGRRILAASVADPSLPPVDDWIALGRSAIVGTLIVAVLVGLPTGLAGVALLTDGSPIAAAASPVVGVSVVALVFVAGAYLTPAALAVCGGSSGVDRLSGGGRSPRSAIGSIVTSRDYVVATLQAILVLFTIGAATLMLVVTVFGLVFLPAVVFFGLVLAARRYAYAVDRALDPSVIEGLEERTMPWL